MCFVKVVIVALALFVGCARTSDEVAFSEAERRTHEELSQWLELWTPPLSDLTPSSFRLVRENREIGSPIEYLSAFGGTILPSWQRERLLYSPDSLWAVDFWFRQVDSEGYFHRAPDTQVVLLNCSTGRAVRILFCGTPCGFHVVTWTSSSTIIVGGWEECFDIDMDHVRPVIWRLDLRDQRAWLFHGPALDRGHLASIDQGLHQQWRKQFPWLRM